MDVLSIVKDLVIPISIGFASYVFGRRKNKADIKKTNAEAEKLETENKLEQVELFEKINKILAVQNEKYEKYIKELEARIIELESLVKQYASEKTNCDNCETRRAYDKIMATREKRAKKRAEL